jgi:nucleotide-binding universal stress UspA family protein
MIVLKNILVATDFSEPAAIAMAYGRDLARTYQARLHVVHIVEDVLTHYSPEIGLVSEQLQKDLEQLAWRDLDALVTDDDRRTIAMVTNVKTSPNVASGIVEYAKANAIDLIITGTHGRGAVKHLLIGSVAERVVRTAPCPALTVHANEREFIAPDAITVAASA